MVSMQDMEEAQSWFRQFGDSEAPANPSGGGEPGGADVKRRRSAVHLLLGDSVARDSRMVSRLPGDWVINRTRGGATWSTTLRRLDEDLQRWEQGAAAFGLAKGSSIL